MTAIFSVTAIGANKEAVKAAVRALPDHDSFELPNDAGWLIAFPGTTKELSDKLQVTGQKEGERRPVGSTLVLSVVTYYGRGPSDMWEWLKTRFERAP